ncbi:MAG: glycosyltransferase family 39 protein [Spirochaetes bacterium]|nr:glycosyltransferase family 39 protein [Spirochaetota bacterium]
MPPAQPDADGSGNDTGRKAGKSRIRAALKKRAGAAAPPVPAAPDRPAIDIALLLLFLCFGYFVRMALFTGMVWSDDYDYAQLAVMILEGRYNPVDVGAFNLYAWRFVMIYPLAFFFKLFGSTSEGVAVLWPLLSSLGTSVLLYAIGRKLFDSKAGLVAAALHLLYPSDILFSTSVLTETPFNLVIALSVLLFVYGEEEKRWWMKLPLFFLSGAPLALLLYGRPYGVLVLGAYAVFMVMRYFINLRYLAIVAGFAAGVFLIEYLVHAETGRWFENFAVMKRMLDPYFCPTSNISSHLDYYRRSLFNSRMHHPHFYIFVIGAGVLFSWARFGGKVSPEEEKRRRQNGFLVLFWLASILLYIEFGFMNLDHMTLMHKMERYLTIVSAPISLGAAAFLARFANRYSLALTAAMFIAVACWWYLRIMPPEAQGMLFPF